MACGGKTDESGSEGMRVFGEGVLPVSGQHGRRTGTQGQCRCRCRCRCRRDDGFQTSETWHRNSRITRPRTKGQMTGYVESYMASRSEGMGGQTARVEFLSNYTGLYLQVCAAFESEAGVAFPREQPQAGFADRRAIVGTEGLEGTSVRTKGQRRWKVGNWQLSHASDRRWPPRRARRTEWQRRRSNAPLPFALSYSLHAALNAPRHATNRTHHRQTFPSVHSSRFSSAQPIMHPMSAETKEHWI